MGERDTNNSNFRALVLAILVLQNSTLVLVMRSSRLSSGTLYLPSTVVFLGEIFKIIVSMAMLFVEQRSISALVELFNIHIIKRPMDCAKISIPAFLYLLQNNLTFVAISNIESAYFQVLYQLKIFTTAIMSVCLLNRKLTLQHWAALGILFAGVVLVQLSSTGGTNAAPSKEASDENDRLEEQNPMLGFLAILVAVCCSGLSGVWFEKIVKQSSTSLWIRNFQLSFFSLIISVFTIAMTDLDKIREGGFFQGYNMQVCLVILLQAGGGLLVSLVVKYADNILKGFACSLASLLSTLVSVYLFDFHVSLLFAVGATLVLSATFMYGIVDSREKEKARVLATSEPKKPDAAKVEQHL